MSPQADRRPRPKRYAQGAEEDQGRKPREGVRGFASTPRKENVGHTNSGYQSDEPSQERNEATHTCDSRDFEGRRSAHAG